jgi:cytochrome c
MKLLLIVSALGMLMPASQADASDDVDELYKIKNCLACHHVERNTRGPSFKSIAAKYADDKDAGPKLAKKIREGSVGVWGQVPMPAQAQVNEAEALTLSRWILQLK